MMTLEEKLQGTCSQLPHEITDPIFFPESGGTPSALTRQICGPCPVRELCFEAGLEEADGTWGGATQPELVEERRRRNININGNVPNLIRLTRHEIPLIRARLAEGASYQEVAAEFKVKPNTVGDIKLGRSWANVS